MTTENINKRLAYLREQRENPTGKYREYLVNIYNYILEDSMVDNRGWSKASSRAMLNYVYAGKPDHMGCDLIDGWKKELFDLGYIQIEKDVKPWRFYIIKELDF